MIEATLIGYKENSYFLSTDMQEPDAERVRERANEIGPYVLNKVL